MKAVDIGGCGDGDGVAAEGSVVMRGAASDSSWRK